MYILVSVRDNGHGIAPDLVERVFEPFFTTKEEGRGTGLGLSTVHSIVTQLGGDIWVSSIPGEGSCFTMCLPKARQASGHEEDASPTVAPTSGGETVLLVEDEEGVRKLLSYVLMKQGYRVLDAANGEQALRIFHEHGDEIHLVLTDMVMPGMNGERTWRPPHPSDLRPDLETDVSCPGTPTTCFCARGRCGPGMSFRTKATAARGHLAAKVREALDSPTRPFNPQ